jgi:hypothetical protein
MRFEAFYYLKPYLFFMKRLLLAAGGFLSMLFAGATQQTSSTPLATTAVDQASSKSTTTKQQAQKPEMGVVQVRQREAGYSGTHYSDIFGPRRVKYGKSRWITLT